MSKKLVHWSSADVADWLHHLQLDTYATTFAANKIGGKELASFNRAKFTQLGVSSYQWFGCCTH